MNDPLRATDSHPPPPSAALLAAVHGMQPVKTRVPLRALAVVVAAGLLLPLVTLWRSGPRGDLAHLPRLWVILTALFWAAGAALPLVTALLPPRGQVLPNTARAGRLAVLAAGALLLLGLFTTVDAPGHTLVSQRPFDAAWRHCTTFGLKVTVPMLLVGLFSLRRTIPIGTVGVAAAVGAGAGALAGLALHFLCPVGGGLHVGLAHAGGVVVGALLGVLTLPRFLHT